MLNDLGQSWTYSIILDIQFYEINTTITVFLLQRFYGW